MSVSCSASSDHRFEQASGGSLGLVAQAMARIAKHYRSRFTTIVGFQPTGWSHSQSRGKAGRGKRRQKGTLITYQVQPLLRILPVMHVLPGMP